MIHSCVLRSVLPIFVPSGYPQKQDVNNTTVEKHYC